MSECGTVDSNEREISILVASKRTMGCELYSQALNRHAGFRVAASATSAEEVMGAVRTSGVHVALISTALRDGPLSGLSVLESLQGSFSDIKSVLLFDRDESHVVVPAFRAGARGVFCVGQGEFKSLCRCVERVYAGQVWANSAQLTQVLDTFAHQPAARIVNAEGFRLLTKREEEVVRFAQEGLTNREIASELHLSEYTVRNNLFRIFDKLGVSNRVELALYAINNARRVVMPDLNAGSAEENEPKRRMVGAVQGWNNVSLRRGAG